MIGDLFHFVACQKKSSTELWICTFNEKALASVNLETGESHLIDGPSGFSVMGWAGSNIFLIKDEFLFLVELTGRRLLKYNYKLESTQCYAFMKGHYNCSDLNYLLAFIFDGYVWVFPKYESIIYAFDIDKNEVLEYDIGINEQEKLDCKGEVVFIKALKKDLEVRLYSPNLKRVYTFNLSNKQIRYDSLPSNLSECLDITIFDNIFFALTKKNEIYCWKESELLAKKILDYSSIESGFSRIVATKVNLWILPSRYNEILVYNYKKNRVEKYLDYPEGFAFNEENERQSRFYLSCEEDSIEYFSMCATSHMLYINKEDGKAEWLKINGPSMEEFVALYQKSKVGVVTEKMLPLETFLNIL
ncbi:hypothetical protein [Anaerovibrio lipolyticus]|uniref:hypothetical protein n=1 Tax=Anaerovibrio lipolyticus TaxID=82374 RepID=UPI0004891ED1|nr:hypothetical protein [Anaerovibrio lipolyticus]